MPGQGTYHYVVSQHDADFTGCCAHTSLMNHILQAAGDDADLNGFGLRDLNVGNCSWVLSRMSAEFYTQPKQGEEMVVKTWVSDVGRLMTTRNMIVCDGAGSRIGCAVTQWAVIDIESRHAVDIRANVDYRGKVSDEPLPADPPMRIGRVDNEAATTKSVVYSDLDFNRHMNAMKYITWVLDNAPVELVTASLKRIDINFLREAVLGQRLGLHISEDENSRRYEIREMESGESLCRCRLGFA